MTIHSPHHSADGSDYRTVETTKEAQIFPIPTNGQLESVEILNPPGD
jgi:hypothetical protein